MELKPRQVATSDQRPEREGRNVKRMGGRGPDKPRPDHELVFQDLKEILADTFGIDPREIRPTSRFMEDLGADSLDAIDLQIEFEERYAIILSDDDLLRTQTVGQLVSLIEERSASG